MAARNTLRRAEMSVECIAMAVEFLLRTRRFVPEVRGQFSHTMACRRCLPLSRRSQPAPGGAAHLSQTASRAMH